jgi:hypothetical protein
MTSLSHGEHSENTRRTSRTSYCSSLRSRPATSKRQIPYLKWTSASIFIRHSVFAFAVLTIVFVGRYCSLKFHLIKRDSFIHLFDFRSIEGACAKVSSACHVSCDGYVTPSGPARALMEGKRFATDHTIEIVVNSISGDRADHRHPLAKSTSSYLGTS